MPRSLSDIASLKLTLRVAASEEVQREYGLERVVKLASNENPLGASPKAIEAMTRTLQGLNLYPNGGLDLREVLAAQYDVKVDNVIAGSGSEGIMSNIIRAFLCDEDEVLTTDAAFIGFQVLARSRGVRYRTVPLRRLALRSDRAGRPRSTSTPRSFTWRTRTTRPAPSSPGTSSTSSTSTCRSAC